VSIETEPGLLDRVAKPDLAPASAGLGTSKRLDELAGAVAEFAVGPLDRADHRLNLLVGDLALGLERREQFALLGEAVLNRLHLRLDRLTTGLALGVDLLLLRRDDLGDRLLEFLEPALGDLLPDRAEGVA
jgi:hypothetical protein